MKILPDLHRAGSVPDWETVPESERNEYQKRAAETGGWDTPGNRMTVRGALATLTGLALINADTPATTAVGTALMGYGRWEDVLDGKRADETGTKSSLGEGLDAGTDTFLLFASAAVLRRKGVVPKAQIDSLTAIGTAKLLATGVGKIRGREMHPTATGKHGVFGQWIGVGFDSISRVAEHFELEGVAKTTRVLGSVGLHVGIGMGHMSARGYIRDALSSGKAGAEPGLQ